MSDFQAYLDRALHTAIIDSRDSLPSPEEYDIYEEISQLLIAVRTELEMTQGEVAKATDVSQANLSKFETGNSRPSITTLKKIADTLWIV